MKTILLIRMDKIGDLIVTLPVDALFPNQKVVWFITQGVDFIPQNSIPERTFFSFSKSFSLQNFKTFVKTIKIIKPDAAVVFHGPAWVGVALWVAGVKVRVGVWSKLTSFLFFNKGVRQKRSISDRHELAYNLDLIEKGLGISGQDIKTLPKLKLQAPNSDILEKLSLKKPYVVVHPGMAGSALNWPVAKYQSLIESISQTVVITGTQMDRPWVLPLYENLKHKSNIVWCHEKLNLNELMTVLKNSSALVAPSTGVIHIAASLGVPVFGIYSPRRVETPTRWGPLGDHVEIFMPDPNDGQNTADVMNSIQVETVYKALQKYL